MAAKKRSPAPPRRAQRWILGTWPWLRRPRIALEPHHVDVIALALIALGIFLAGVAYLGWSGGTVGHAMVEALRFLIGALAYAVPVGLVAGGAMLLLRELRPPARPMRTGTLCLVAALTLALAGGTLGLGPGAVHGPSYWHPDVFKHRGGIVGGVEFWAASHLFSNVGADILAVFLFLAGLILVTGAGVAGVIRATSASFAGTGRVIRRRTEAGQRRRANWTLPAAAAAAGRRAETEAMGASVTAQEPLLEPEPDTSEIVIGPTHVEAPPIPYREDAEVSADAEPAPAVGSTLAAAAASAGSSAPVEAAERLTPQGRLRASVTDDPDFVWRVPSARFLTEPPARRRNLTPPARSRWHAHCWRRWATSGSRRR